MKRCPVLSILFSLLVFVWASPSAAAENAGEHPNMITYYLGLLSRGPNWSPEVSEEIMELQRAHLAHMDKLAEAGKLVVAGPITDGGNLRGILVFKVDSLEAAKSLAEGDPMVKNGRLLVELHPWMVEEGVLP